MATNYDIGFLGGGQLARMSIMAAQRMGLRCVSLDAGTDFPAAQIAASLSGRLDDVEALASVLRVAQHVTLENEFIPAAILRDAVQLAARDESCLLPGIDTLATIQDKLHQRQALSKAGVAAPHAVAIEGDGESAIAEIGFPLVLKARFGGYDGKGTRFARSRAEFDSFRELWQGGGWLAESMVPFRQELAAMVFVSADGSHRGAFPTVITVQKDGVCDLVFPHGESGATHRAEIALAAVEAVGGRGLFGVEMFETENGEVSINEIAPRPHNSGHYTLDWGGASQFEQHVRLVMDLPLGIAEGQPTCMANLMGQPSARDSQYRQALAAAQGDPGVFVHWYGKSESRPGRKMGHLNVIGEGIVERALTARQRFYETWTR